jgi:biopolymer transport protein ExbD
MPLKTIAIEEPDLNLTPMIDIVFLLIIFFMVGTRFTKMEREFDVQLPSVSDAQPLTSLPDEIVVNVPKSGILQVDGKERSLTELETDLIAARKRFADQTVVVRADGRGPYQNVADVLAVCQRVGVKGIKLPTRLKTEERE